MAAKPTASFRKLAVICGWVGVAAIAAGVWTTRAANLHGRHELPEGVRSPILALELIRDPELLDRIARPDPTPQGDLPAPRPRHEREHLANAVKIDMYAFIPAYALFMVLVGVLCGMSSRRIGPVLGVIVIGATLAGAVFDVRENLAMLELLRGGTADPRWPSLMKWGLVSAAIVCSVPLFIDRTAQLLLRVIGYVAALFAMVSGAEGAIGALSGNDQLIEAAAGRMGMAFLAAVAFLLGRRPLENGLVPALNALAGTWPFNRLVGWPTGDQNETVGEPVYTVDEATGVSASRRTP